MNGKDKYAFPPFPYFSMIVLCNHNFVGINIAVGTHSFSG